MFTIPMLPPVRSCQLVKTVAIITPIAAVKMAK